MVWNRMSTVMFLLCVETVGAVFEKRCSERYEFNGINPHAGAGGTRVDKNNVNSMDECETFCLETPFCNAYTWHGHDHGSHWRLKCSVLQNYTGSPTNNDHSDIHTGVLTAGCIGIVALEWLEPSVSVNLIDDDTTSCLQLPLQLSVPSNVGKLRMTSSRGTVDAVRIKLTSQNLIQCDTEDLKPMVKIRGPNCLILEACSPLGTSPVSGSCSYTCLCTGDAMCDVYLFSVQDSATASPWRLCKIEWAEQSVNN